MLNIGFSVTFELIGPSGFLCKIFTIRQQSCWKVRFSVVSVHQSVILFTERGLIWSLPMLYWTSLYSVPSPPHMGPHCTGISSSPLVPTLPPSPDMGSLCTGTPGPNLAPHQTLNLTVQGFPYDWHLVAINEDPFKPPPPPTHYQCWHLVGNEAHTINASRRHASYFEILSCSFVRWWRRVMLCRLLCIKHLALKSRMIIIKYIFLWMERFFAL